jgi:tetratricopeptide (TPR) repeat protein
MFMKKPVTILVVVVLLAVVGLLAWSHLHGAKTVHTDRYLGRVGTNSAATAGLPIQWTVAYNAKEYEKVQTMAGQAISDDPMYVQGWMEYGMASVRLGQMDKARHAYEQALSLFQVLHREDPSNAKLMYEQAIILLLLGESDKAEITLKQAHTDYPADKNIAYLTKNITQAQQNFKSETVEP